VNTPASGALPGARQPSRPYRICLVCLGNICRSPMAETVLREVLARSGLAGAVTVDSAGTGDWHVGERMFGPAMAELARRGYDGSAHRARQIQPSWIPDYDLIVGMDRANVADLRGIAADGDAGRIRLLRTFDPALAPGDPYSGDVPDPFGGSAEDYALAFDLVLAATTGLAGQLARLPGIPARGRA